MGSKSQTSTIWSHRLRPSKSVHAIGSYLEPPQLDVPFWILKFRTLHL
ncbi:MAG: hypothetical protein WAT22_03065 [Saprospiraceae bacterium]|nr:hypothetical protein [Saprospiraceae bacterium]